MALTLADAEAMARLAAAHPGLVIPFATCDPRLPGAAPWQAGRAAAGSFQQVVHQ